MDFEKYISKFWMLINSKQFDEAFEVALTCTGEHPTWANGWYMAGQAQRYQNNFDAAITYLSEAVRLGSNAPSYFLALGIAYQQNEQIEQALAQFEKAVNLDKFHIPSYNSMGYTYKIMGEYEKAYESFMRALQMLTHSVARRLENDIENPIVKHEQIFSDLTFREGMEAAMGIAKNAKGLDYLAWPTAEMAMKEEQTEEHRGLYWIDKLDEKGSCNRLFLPNFFNAFSNFLAREEMYPTLVSNLAGVLEKLGRLEEAEEYVNEEKRFFG